MTIWDLQLQQITIHEDRNILTYSYLHLRLVILAVENSGKPCYL